MTDDDRIKALAERMWAHHGPRATHMVVARDGIGRIYCFSLEQAEMLKREAADATQADDWEIVSVT